MLIVWLKSRIQGHSFPYHWITKANIVICHVLQQPLANLLMLALNSVVVPILTSLRKSFFEMLCSSCVSCNCMCKLWKNEKKIPLTVSHNLHWENLYKLKRSIFSKFHFLTAKCLQLSTHLQILSNILGTSYYLRLGNVGANNFIKCNVKSHGSLRKGHGN